MINEPLIYTTKGNLPVACLSYWHQWIDNENEVAYIEEYWVPGEMVRRSVYAKLKKGLELGAEQAQL